MCPCRVKTDIDDFWTRVLEMTDDPAPNVRYQVNIINQILLITQVSSLDDYNNCDLSTDLEIIQYIGLC